MKIQPVYETKYSRIQEIVPLPISRPGTTITVSQRVDMRADISVWECADISVWECADINWPAIGSQEADVTMAFANALIEAAAIAEKWNAERAGRELNFSA